MVSVGNRCSRNIETPPGNCNNSVHKEERIAAKNNGEESQQELCDDSISSELLVGLAFGSIVYKNLNASQ
jgi:hypothetical protein